MAENPFKSALERAQPEEATTLGEGTSPSQADLLRTVEDLNIVDPEVLRSMPKVAKLTVKDLNDLAAEFNGVPSGNPKVKDFTLEDLQDLEGVFFEYKVAALRQVQSGQDVTAEAWSVSCCCCTPCCCCAAADVEEATG